MFVITTVAFVVVLPFLFLGVPRGHDFKFHVFSWMEVLEQWKNGIIYPRWASLAQWGYGDARFVFYPPASLVLGAALGALFPWRIATGVYIWIALSAAGTSMFFLARHWLSRKDAIFAAALYASNPYHIVIVYWRSAFAELLASALLPVLLLFVVRLEGEGRKMILPLGLVVTAAWLTNAPAAVMVNYSLVLMVIVAALMQRSPRILLNGAAAFALGTALAAFYLLPAAYEQKWVNIAQLLVPGLRPQDNSLFTTAYNPHQRFNQLVSIVAAGDMIILAGAAWSSRKFREQKRLAWWILIVWAGGASLLMFPFASVFWEYLPKFRFIQFPWRWLLCLNVALSMLVVMGVRRVLSRALICGVMLAVIGIAWQRVRPKWQTAADFQEMNDEMQADHGYRGAEEYVPAASDTSYELNRDVNKVSGESNTSARINVLEWGAKSKRFTAEVNQPTRLVLRLFNYPAWQVEVNDRVMSAETREVTGQMVLLAQPGENRIRVTFIRTWDRIAGEIVSCAMVLVLALVNWRRAYHRGKQRN